MMKLVIKPMTNMNIGNIKYVDKTSFWEALGVLLVTFWMSLGTFWGLLGCLRGSLGDPWGARGASWGHIWDEVPKEDLPNFRKSGTGAPQRWPREPKRPPDGHQKCAKRPLMRPQRPLKWVKKTIQKENDENLNFEDHLERNAWFCTFEINEIWSFLVKQKKGPQIRWNNKDDVKKEFRRANMRSKIFPEAHFEAQKAHDPLWSSGGGNNLWASGAPSSNLINQLT